MRHWRKIFLIIDVILRHETVRGLDAALREISRRAKILAILAAGLAMRMRAGTPNGWHHEVALLESAHFRPHFHHLAQRFVTNHQVIETFRRRSINKVANLLVRSADSDLE